jgi:hypothetical protein
MPLPREDAETHHRSPAVEEDPRPSNVTICHHTESKKNPTVTITVGEDAVEAFLAQGDELGACAD